MDEEFLKAHPKVLKSLQHRNKIVNEKIPEIYDQIKDIVVPKQKKVRRKPPPVPIGRKKPVVTVRTPRPTVNVVRRSARLQKGV
mgnify:CR=1 FL=1